jgi:myo-inositol-1(or 4)-monophosphatase
MITKVGRADYLCFMDYHNDWEALLGPASETVHRTADFIRTQYGSLRASDVLTKGHNSLVSFVDRKAEEMLVSGLSHCLPGAGFLTEEETTDQSLEGGLRWIIDPLDGTTNFIHGLPLFSISVALEADGDLVLGIIHDVMGGAHYTACIGRGAICNGQPIQVSAVNQLADSLLATGFPYYDYGQTAAYLRLLEEFMRKSRGIRRLGSAALDLAWTASGRFGGFYEYGLHPWDVAAGVVLVREAGGVVCDFRGGSDFLAGKTLIAGSPGIVSAMQSEISTYF